MLEDGAAEEIAIMENKPDSTIKSGEMDSFSRLYYDGLQQKRDRQQAIEDKLNTRDVYEASQMQNYPRISKISDAVAKQMPQRPKKAEQFQKYSIEWKKLRDAKV